MASRVKGSTLRLKGNSNLELIFSFSKVSKLKTILKDWFLKNQYF